VQETLHESRPDSGEWIKDPDFLPAIRPYVFGKAVVHKFSREPRDPRDPAVKRINLVAREGGVAEAVCQPYRRLEVWRAFEDRRLHWE
jgi:hypothetical protein